MENNKGQPMNQDERDLRAFETWWITPSLKSPYGIGDGLYSPASLAVSRRKEAAKHAYIFGITHERQRKAEEVAKKDNEIFNKLIAEWSEKHKQLFIENDEEFLGHTALHFFRKAWQAATQLAEQEARKEIEDGYKREGELKDRLIDSLKQIKELKTDLEWALNNPYAIVHAKLFDEGCESLVMTEQNKEEYQIFIKLKKHFPDRQKQLADKEK